MDGLDFGISGKIRFSALVLTDVKLFACLIGGLVAVTFALNLVTEFSDVMDTSEKAEP